MIIVGVDGSKQSRAALRFAFDEAALRGASLRVVHVWQHATGGLYTYPAGAPDEPRQTRAEEEQAWLRRFVRRSAPPAGVQFEVAAVAGDPAHVLVDAARDAELLVVGSHGRGGLSGMILGSVSRYCAQHATCPVVIVH